MALRSFHQIGIQPCNTCATPQSGYFNDAPPISSDFNIYKGTTSRTCVMPTYVKASKHYLPVVNGGPEIPLVDTTPAGNFQTNPQHPAKNSLLVNPADFAVADVFLATSLTSTNLDGITTQHILAPQILSVTRPNQVTTLPNNTNDTPLRTLGGYMLGSFDQILMQLFSNTPYNFQVLTNPNEILYGTPDLVQFVWPDGLDWTLTFTAPSDDSGTGSLYAYQYTYASNGILTYVRVDSNNVPNATVQQNSFVGGTCKTFSVFDSPTGYITQRQPFDLTFPGNPPVCNGVTGVTGFLVSGQMCVVDISIDNLDIPINTACLCSPFYNEPFVGISGLSGTTIPTCPIPQVPSGQQNKKLLVDLLNAAFRRYFLRGWTAFEDFYYPYFRITYPDNVLKFTITIKKFFFDAFGIRQDCWTEIQEYSQNATTTFVKKAYNGATTISSNSFCVLDGYSWSLGSSSSGCFFNDPNCQ
uniref:Uncharacterized protein n=1 Tax=viral metagenome TaxID=1070528 RepID=A0A6C0JTJ6_9ZZZZ